MGVQGAVLSGVCLCGCVVRVASGSAHQDHPAGRRRDDKDRKRLEEAEHAGTLPGTSISCRLVSAHPIRPDSGFTEEPQKCPI